MLNMNVMCVYALSAQLRRREQRLHFWKLWLKKREQYTWSSLHTMWNRVNQSYAK
jgi:hypothetical protein